MTKEDGTKEAISAKSYRLATIRTAKLNGDVDEDGGDEYRGVGVGKGAGNDGGH